LHQGQEGKTKSKTNNGKAKAYEETFKARAEDIRNVLIPQGGLRPRPVLNDNITELKNCTTCSRIQVINLLSNIHRDLVKFTSGFGIQQTNLTGNLRHINLEMNNILTFPRILW